MSDQDKPNNGALVPAERRDLTSITAATSLVTRGLLDLVNLERPDHPSAEVGGNTITTCETAHPAPCFFSSWLTLHCARCSWSVEDHWEIERCPKCDGLVAADRTLGFGALEIDYRSRRNNFLLACPHTDSQVKIAEADVPDSIRFLIGHFRVSATRAEPPNQQPYALGWLDQHCTRCNWSVKDRQAEIERCPKCNGHVAPDRTLRFGRLSIEYSSANKFWLACPQTQVRVYIDTADVPETIRFLTRYFRNWASQWASKYELNVLAAAYAETGEFDEAVRYQTKALEDPAYRGPDGNEFRQRLELYKRKNLFREKAAIVAASFTTRKQLSDQEPKVVLATPLAELNLSTRTRMCMNRLCISSLGDLVLRSADELLETKDFGEVTLREVREKLSQFGLNLRSE